MPWAALLDPQAGSTSPPADGTASGLACWALQFTPRVVLLADAVVMDVTPSVRLFGGMSVLRARVVEGAQELGVATVSWASTGLGALCLARGGVDGLTHPLGPTLDALPLTVLDSIRAHEGTLSRLGCRTLGAVRALPRGGIARRFDRRILTDLDQAYGLAPEAYAWLQAPDTFLARLELGARVELAPALLYGARRLLVQLVGWLAARRAGVTWFRLRWAHDAIRSRSVGEFGDVTIRTARPTRDVEHLCRLLAEHLARVTLEAPAGELWLAADEPVALVETSADLLPDASRTADDLQLTLERIAARLGPQHVLQPLLHEDHRLEWVQHWVPAPTPQPPRQRLQTDAPQPTWLLEPPLRLAVRRDQPMYQGPLQLLAGPHRVEGGWWHRQGSGEGASHAHVQRDYWVARSDHAGVLWIFHERLAQDQGGWYLHGIFA